MSPRQADPRCGRCGDKRSEHSNDDHDHAWMPPGSDK